MGFGFLAHGERVEASPGRRRRMRDGECDGIGAQREAADRVGCPAAVIERGQRDAADQELARAGHRGEAGVDVPARARAAAQDELAGADRAISQQPEQADAVIAPLRHPRVRARRALPPSRRRGRDRMRHRGAAAPPPRPRHPAAASGRARRPIR